MNTSKKQTLRCFHFGGVQMMLCKVFILFALLGIQMEGLMFITLPETAKSNRLIMDQ